MWGAHLFLLLCRNILFLTRSKLWLLGEIVPSLILIIIQYYVCNNITEIPVDSWIKVSYRELSSFDINGNISDIPNLATHFIPDELYSKALLLYYEDIDNRSTKIFFNIQNQLTKLYGQNVYVKRMRKFEDFVNKIHSKGNVITIDRHEILLEQVVGLYIHRLKKNSINYTFYVQTLPTDMWNSDKYWFDPFLYYSKNILINNKPVQPPYLQRGLLSYQVALLKIISSNNEDNDTTPIMLKPFPHYSQMSSPKQYMFDALPFLWSIVIIFTITHSVGAIVAEKELKIKSYLRVIGVTNLSYYGSFYICNFIKLLWLFGFFTHPIYLTAHYTNNLLVIILVIMYTAALCSFILFLSTLFSDSLNSMKVTFCLWLALCIETYIIADDQYKTFEYIYKSLNINNPFRYAIRNFAWAELRSIELSFFNMFDDPNNFFATGYCIFMLAFDTLFYLFLAFYISALYPKDGSPSITSYEFFFGSQFNIQTRSMFDFQESASNIFLGRDQVNWDVRLRHCTKIWSSTGERVLDALTFTAKHGEITTLIGHNGAGKSTTYAILAGLTNLTSGRIYIGKENLIKNFDKFKGVIGYCPQYDAFFPHLTIFEQIFLVTLLKKKVYGNIFWRSSKAAVIIDEIKYYLKSLNLVDVKNQKPFKLPGGTRRKVSLCMALAGDSKILLLDEPRSSTDIDSNIEIDKLLKRIKANKTIILATHILDEEASFSDKLVFLSKGYVAASGTQKDLMAKFAPGYILNIQYKCNTTNEMINNSLILIKQIIPEGRVHNNSKLNEVSFLLSFAQKKDCITLLHILEKNMNILKASEYQLFKTTFEDAYLKMDYMADMSNEGLSISDNARKFANAICGIKRKKIEKGFPLTYHQVKCIITKHIVYMTKHWYQFAFQWLVPLSLITYKLFFSPDNGFAPLNQMIKFNYQYLRPFVLPYLVEENVSVKNDIDERFINRSIEDIEHDLITRYSKGKVTVKQVDKMYTPTEFYLKFFMSKEQLGFGFEFHNPLNIYNVTIRFNSIAIHSIMIAVVEYFETFRDAHVEASLKILSPRNINGSVVTKTNYSPSSEIMPWLLDVKQDSTSAFIVLVLYGVLHTSHSMIFLIEERTSQFKHQQLSASISKKVFYLGSFIFNLITFLIGLVFIMIGLMVVFPSFLHFKNIICFCTILITYYMANAPFVWMMSEIFNTPLKGYIFMIAFQLLFPMLFFVLSFIIVMFFHKFLPVQGFQAIGFLSPSGCLIFHLTDIAGYMTFNNIVDYSHTFDTLLKIQAIRGFITYLFFWFMEDDYIQYVYHRKIKKYLFKSIKCFNSNAVGNIETSITQEINTNEEIIVSNLGKKNSKKYVLKNINFKVSKNECFCLLGSNGVGKTLIFDILTKRTYATEGYYYIKGIQLNRNQAKIGYCQQTDSFMSEFTVDEIMIFFAKLLGYINFDEIVNEIVECFGLEKHRFKNFNKLSGGQKKKLAFSLAVLVGEDILLLDEPTSAVDPKSRRFIWEFLKALTDLNRTILISTHNIGECEYLSTKIGYFKKDKTFEIGAVDHVKKIFANGFIISITIENPSLENWMEIQKMIMENFVSVSVNFRPFRRTNEWKISPSESRKTWLEVNSDVDRIMSQFQNDKHKNIASNYIAEIEDNPIKPIVISYDLSNCAFDKVLFEYIIKQDEFKE